MRNDIFTKLDLIEDNIDLYYIALCLLMSKSGGTFSNVPELCLALDEENLERFLNIFGGRKIRVPTKEQFSNYMKAVISYYYMEVCGFSKKDAMKKSGSVGNSTVGRYVDSLKKDLSNICGDVI